jgi:tetratricopeptide (TPR) repeat protein
MLTDEIGGLEAAREALARERLEELQALARTYRSWSVKELAFALGRQPGRLVPESGMPKIDLVVALVDHLVKPPSETRKSSSPMASTDDYASLYNESLKKRVERDFTEAIRLAVRACAVADNPTRRAAALVVEAQAHEAAGSYTEAVRCLRNASRIEGITVDWRLMCDANLANMLFMQGQATHALGIASSVLDYAQSVSDTAITRWARVLASWARGHALRSSIPTQNHEPWKPLARSAREDFRVAAELVAELHESVDGATIYYGTMAASIESITLELDAMCDDDAAEPVVRRLLAIVRDDGSCEPSLGERKAWAAVALANTVKRFVTDEMQRRGILEVASATLRAHAVATTNWYFAHQHLELDAERRRCLTGNGVASRALDAVEAKLVAGVLGQIPAARRSAGEFLALYGTREGVRA